ncbi:Mitochondrial escape protein 2-like protein [Frankliniella fusca]|uniref:Mitochondrial escape protein 2-like protein n=1 Tax=Frankliniella fusca TaxID=407009 RepID=A0AAE1HFL6_9NEOP|nr:Mitochondrial escape protein 2-like protein [Frankliniella fusca]
MDLRFSHPSNVLVCAPSGGGKTHLVKRVVENRYNMFNVSFVKVVWYYSEYQGAYDELAQKHGREHHQWITSRQGKKPKLVIVDDFLDQIKNPEFLKIAIKGSHHRNLSFWFLTQALFPPNFRQISLQAHYVILLKSPRDIQQMRTLALQVDPANWRGMLEAYLDATQEGHSYILFDFHVRQQDHLRLRTHIFPGENTVVYIPNGKYKKSLIFQK